MKETTIRVITEQESRRLMNGANDVQDKAARCHDRSF